MRYLSHKLRNGELAFRCVLFFLVLFASECRAIDQENSGPIDLRSAQVLVPKDLVPPEKKAIDLFVEEIAARTRLRLPVVHTLPGHAGIPIIAVGQTTKLPNLVGDLANDLNADTQLHAEGFRIRTKSSKDRGPLILVAGNDSRGVLYGVGKLLRSLDLSRDRVALAAPLNLKSAAFMPIRGHQLGYRPKTNSYDAWNLAQWEQYIRDLAIFGCNSIELIPPRSDDDADSPHFPLPQMEMMIGMSKLANDYGLDVWIWYPAMEPNYASPAAIRAAAKEWGEVLSKLPRVNALLVPTGDPGDAPPHEFMAMLAAQAEQLKRLHPDARIWISMQSFSQREFDEMLGILKREPDWLGGIVFGPQTRVSIARLREMLPQRYPIRGYPDITHSLRCEYPVPDWDLAYALTEGREVINPRPIDETTIFQLYKDHTRGAITYSEGCNDDVNKMIWSALCWDPNAKPIDTLHEYSRYFLGPKYTDDFADGLVALERNWRGSLMTNDGVKATLEKFRRLEAKVEPRTLRNWRFQSALYRAYYDAYQQQRLAKETAQETEAMKILVTAKQTGARKAMDDAEAVLDHSELSKDTQQLERRVNELAEALFQSIGMQLSVEKYKAIEVGRGANLDELNVPLNNRDWLKDRFAQLRKLNGDTEVSDGIDEILHWTDPGTGGFYDDLGNPSLQPHLVRTGSYVNDPGFLHTPFTGLAAEPGWRRSWCTHVDGRYGTPVMLHYANLDSQASYKLRVVYAGDNFEAKVRLVAKAGPPKSPGREFEIHPHQLKPEPVKPVEFEIPIGATSGGELTLTWQSNPERRGAGRGCQIGEVWLIKVREN